MAKRRLETEPSSDSAANEPAPLTDIELIEACIGGDQAAWRMLVERFGRLVFSIPWRYGLGEEAAEDVSQEVFAILVRQLPRLRRRTALPAWLITTTHRICRRRLRRRAVSLEDVHPALESGSPPEEDAARWERQHLVQQALARLGDRCRELITELYMTQGPVSYEEVARRLNMPVGSIGPTRARCLQKLLELLE